MRAFFAIVIALAAMLPGAARASDYLYTFSGVVSFADNGDYANEGDPIAFSLRVRDSFHHVSYVYSPTGSSAIGGPDYAAGTLFPVDRTVYYPQFSNHFTPLEDGYRPDDDYSASISKDLATESLAFGFHVQLIFPPDPLCEVRCDQALVNYFADVQVSSNAFISPDFREVGSFDLTPGSYAHISDYHDGCFAYECSTDENQEEIDLSHLTVERLPDAVPEPDAWIMMIGGLGFTGAAMRRRSNATARFASAT